MSEMRELTDAELDAIGGAGCGGDIVKGAITFGVLGAFFGGPGVIVGLVGGAVLGALHGC